MTDVRLKDPRSDFVAVVGSPIEAANLRAAGYTDVEDEPAPPSGDEPSGDGGPAGEAPPSEQQQSGEKPGEGQDPTANPAVSDSSGGTKPARRPR